MFWVGDVMEMVLERTWVKGEKKKRAIQKALHLIKWNSPRMAVTV